jgi:hypothetical protein
MDGKVLQHEYAIAQKARAMEIPWLLERGFKALAERNITALQASSRA